MKKMIFLLIGMLSLNFLSNASYTVAGTSSITSVGRGGSVSWTCPGGGTCFYGGSGSSPAPGDRIVLVNNGYNWNVTLMSAKVSDDGGEFSGIIDDDSFDGDVSISNSYNSTQIKTDNSNANYAMVNSLNDVEVIEL
jgi:hypothetical protein